MKQTISFTSGAHQAIDLGITGPVDYFKIMPGGEEPLFHGIRVEGFEVVTKEGEEGQSVQEESPRTVEVLYPEVDFHKVVRPASFARVSRVLASITADDGGSLIVESN